MQGKYHISTGKMILLTVGVWVIALGLVSMLIKEETRCAYSGCNNRVASEGKYCYEHNTPGKRRHATYGTSGSHYNSTSKNSSSSSSKSNASSSSKSNGSSSYKPSNTHNSSHSHNSYDDGYDDVYFNNDYDQKRYDSDDDYATGVDDAIEDDMEDSDEGGW